MVTIHGIQTTGKWQKGITPYLAQRGLVPYHLDYGWFVVVGVVNVDGLKSIPAPLQNPQSEDCKVVQMALFGGVLKRFPPILEAAFRGESLPVVEG